mmetsp:Transcript_3399/g.526  ORF Transcript_3399/g.526 Transcript_3399/m.526 type:complete len:145 (-) Transcript_3399:143-577(-)
MGKYTTAKIVISGHSLGGAVATIFAAHLLKLGYPVTELVTFGSPRVGNKEFAMYVSSRIPKAIRIVHNRDPVPCVPLLKQGFLHVSTLYYYPNPKNSLEYHTCVAKEGEEDVTDKCTKIFTMNINDHLNYLGKSTDCNTKLELS